MNHLTPSHNDSRGEDIPSIRDNGTDYFPWEDPADKGIDWGKLVLEYEPAEGPPGDASEYSDIRDISKIRDTQEYKDELLTKE